MPQAYIPSGVDPFSRRARPIAHIYKGAERGENDYYGSNLGEFLRFSPVGGAQGDRALQIFRRSYEGKPSGQNGWITKQPINIYFPYKEWWLDLLIGYGQYSKGGGLQRFCTGERLIGKKVRYMVPQKKGPDLPSHRWESTSEPCPAATSPFPCEACGGPGQGRIISLKFYIAELYDAGIQKPVILNNTAINESGIVEQLMMGAELLERYEANISYIPARVASMLETQQFVSWQLCRTPEMIGKPAFQGRTPTGNQTQDEEWLLNLSICPKWIQTVQERSGRGHYYRAIDGRIVNSEEAKLEFLEKTANCVERLARVGAIAGQFLPAQTANFVAQQALPPMTNEDIFDAELIEDGIDLSGTSPVPEAVAETLGCEEAPLRSPQKPDMTNANRLMACARQLGLEDAAIRAAITHLYGEQVKSPQLTQEHMRSVVRRLMVVWANTQSFESGEPIFLGDEAEAFMEEVKSQLRGKDETQINKWMELINTRRSLNTSETKQQRSTPKPKAKRKAS